MFYLFNPIRFWKQASVCTRLGNAIHSESFKPHCLFHHRPRQLWHEVEPSNTSECIWTQFGVPLSSPPPFEDDDSDPSPIADISLHYHSADAIVLMKKLDATHDERKWRPVVHDDDSSVVTRKRKREVVLIDLT